MQDLGWKRMWGSCPAARRGARLRAGLTPASASNKLSCLLEMLHSKQLRSIKMLIHSNHGTDRDLLHRHVSATDMGAVKAPTIWRSHASDYDNWSRHREVGFSGSWHRCGRQCHKDVNLIDKRVLEWDGNPSDMPTKDKLYVSVDLFARWRIIDPLQYFLRLHDERSARIPPGRYFRQRDP